ncbi:MAG: HAD-IIIC family phosphatase, partial [Magnetovibrio sp.]|nr:HAD-IIIC family phosphatase [Magnetovibrio sp.]
AKAGNSDVSARLQQLFELASAKLNATIIVNTFLSPRHRDGAASTAASKAAGIEAANQFVRQFVKDNSANFYLCDWDQYVQDFGYDASVDRRYWYMAKAPFKPPFLSRYATDIAKLARAITGLNKKCLVLDCDGTLWGGVIGEDGMEGINLHPDDYPGNVFYEVQRAVLELRERGILLAINSKTTNKMCWRCLKTTLIVC